MNDQELADKVVSLGVGAGSERQGVEWRYCWGDFGRLMYAKDFVRDWRVLGALIEIVQNSGRGVKIYPHATVRDLVEDMVDQIK